MAAGNDQGGRRTTSEPRQRLTYSELKPGIPRYGTGMDETTVVTETDLDVAVSFHQGCYLGREIIVASGIEGACCQENHHRFPDRVAIDDGARFSLDDKEVGRITSTTFSPKLNRTIALAYVSITIIWRELK